METTYSIFPYLQIPLKCLPLCNNLQTIFSGTYKSFICCVNNNGEIRNRLWKLTLRLRGRQGRCVPISSNIYLLKVRQINKDYLLAANHPAANPAAIPWGGLDAHHQRASQLPTWKAWKMRVPLRPQQWDDNLYGEWEDGGYDFLTVLKVPSRNKPGAIIAAWICFVIFFLSQRPAQIIMW